MLISTEVTWNERAAETAKNWSRKCQPQRFPREERKVDGILCGETRLRATYPSSWSDVIDTWNQKASNFEYGVGAINPRKNIYFYTQIIWHDSHQIGCALVYCGSNEYRFSYACIYCPVGNLAEEVATPYKKGPSCGDCPDTCEDKLCTQSCKYFDNLADCNLLLNMFSCENNIILNLCKATCKATKPFGNKLKSAVLKWELNLF
ncbi:Cysteine-rich venom protein triflin [Varanus komodoensis]|nr:Cysteine-rich venom protein triflin [Varanus komodoensis]